MDQILDGGASSPHCNPYSDDIASLRAGVFKLKVTNRNSGNVNSAISFIDNDVFVRLDARQLKPKASG